jgi:NADH-quinone oxidoreductase subunit N
VTGLHYGGLLILVAPETIVVITALVVLGVDLFAMREQPLRIRFWIGAAFSSFGCVAASAWLLAINLPSHGAMDVTGLPLLQGMFVDDPLSRMVRVAVLVLTILTILLSMESSFTDHVGEYLAVILFAATGMMLLVAAQDILMIFISLELTSLSLYVLTAFNKRNARSAEAALKYYLFGGMAAAFTLFGLSLVYGLTGSTGLREIAARLDVPSPDPLLLAALVMTIIGFGFKVAAAPFHLWAPDAYQGAPTPSAAFIASGSKVASFFVFARVMMLGFPQSGGSASWHDYAPGWLPILALLAAASMLLGNLAAIGQTSVKRLLAYSAIAHGGYALLGIMANGSWGLAALTYYVATYGLTVVGAFGVVSLVEDRTGDARLRDFAGLARSEPLLALCMLVFMLSLAGIPPLAGFFGKFYVFTAALAGAKNLGMLWLVVFAIATSAVSLYYYLQVLKQIYVAPLPEGAAPRPVPASSRVVIGAIACGVVLLGCVPNVIVSPLLSALEISSRH